MKTLKPRVRTHCVTRIAPPTKRDRGRPWMRKRERVLKRDNYLCVKCMADGRVAVAKEVDHIVPLHRGGGDDEGNLQALCVECHRAKTSEEMRRSIQQISTRENVSETVKQHQPSKHITATLT